MDDSCLNIFFVFKEGRSNTTGFSFTKGLGYIIVGPLFFMVYTNQYKQHLFLLIQFSLGKYMLTLGGRKIMEKVIKRKKLKKTKN